MTRDEFHSFCQFLVQNGAIAPATVNQLLMDPSVKSSVAKPAREAAMAIVQHAIFMKAWLKPGVTMPSAIADAWLKPGRQTQQASSVAPETYESTEAMPGRGKQASQRLASAAQSAPAAPAAEELPAKLGAYRIEGKLGEGGMGAVYRGVNDELGITVAVKIIRPDMVGPEEVERFKREARVTVALTSPHLVRMYTAELNHRPPYIAMEYVRGKPLDKAMEKRLASGDMLWRIEMIAKVCDGVAVMHEHGVVHRDLKPGNIMVDENGRPVVLDLGLVKPLGKPEPASEGRSPSGRAPLVQDDQLTEAGVMAGTPMYMAPEQAVSDNEKIGKASDVYSLGKILFQVLTGTHVHMEAGRMALLLALSKPFPEEAEKIFRERVRPKHDPDRLLGIIKTCMALEPGDRYPDAAALAKALREYSHWLRTHEEEERKARDEAQAKRTRLLNTAMAAAAVIAVAMGGVALFYAKASREAEARAQAEGKLAAEERQRADAQAQAAEAAEARATAEARASETARRSAQNSSEFLVCQSLMRASRWSDAEVRLRAIVQRDGSYEPARYALAQVQYNLLDAACLTQWEWLMEHGSPERRSEYLFYYIIHHEHLQSQLHTAYVPLLQRMQDERYRRIATAWLRVFHSQAERLQGNDERANELLNDAFQVLPTLQEGDELLWLWEAMNGFLSWLEAEGKPEAEKSAKLLEARAYLEKAAARNTDFPMIQFWLGDVLKQLGDLAGAAAAFHRVEVLMPTWAPPKYMRRQCYQLMAEQQNAAPELRLQIATDTIAVCTPMLADTRMDDRQAVMARITLMNAHIAAGDIYRARGDTAAYGDSQRTIFGLLTDLVQRPLKPDELLEMHIKRLTMVRPGNVPQLRHEVAENARQACEALLARPNQPLRRVVRAKLLLMQAYLDGGSALVHLNRRPEAASAFTSARNIALELNGRRDELGESDMRIVDEVLRITQPRQKK